MTLTSSVSCARASVNSRSTRFNISASRSRSMHTRRKSSAVINCRSIQSPNSLQSMRPTVKPCLPLFSWCTIAPHQRSRSARPDSTHASARPCRVSAPPRSRRVWRDDLRPPMPRARQRPNTAQRHQDNRTHTRPPQENRSILPECRFVHFVIDGGNANRLALMNGQRDSDSLLAADPHGAGKRDGRTNNGFHPRANRHRCPVRR